jgi:hypothetical protein
MAQYVRKIALDFNAKPPNKTVFAKQLDQNSRFLLIEPQFDGDKFDARDCTVALYAQRPDKQIITVDGEVTEEGDLLVELTNDVTALCGIVRCDMKLSQSEQLLSSCLFDINVIPSVGLSPAPAPVSDSDHQIITVDLYQPDTRTVDPVITNIPPSVCNTQVVDTSWQNLDGYDENDFKGDISL